jgi:hypothetical protein
MLRGNCFGLGASRGDYARLFLTGGRFSKAALHRHRNRRPDQHQEPDATAADGLGAKGPRSDAEALRTTKRLFALVVGMDRISPFWFREICPKELCCRFKSNLITTNPWQNPRRFMLRGRPMLWPHRNHRVFLIGDGVGDGFAVCSHNIGHLHLCLTCRHEQGPQSSNRAENSHQPMRTRVRCSGSERQTEFAGRAIQQIYNVKLYNQHGNLVDGRRRQLVLSHRARPCAPNTPMRNSRPSTNSTPGINPRGDPALLDDVQVGDKR